MPTFTERWKTPLKPEFPDTSQGQPYGWANIVKVNFRPAR